MDTNKTHFRALCKLVRQGSLAFLVISLFLSPLVKAVPQECKALVPPPVQELELTENFISYLQLLINEQVLKTAHIQQLNESLKQKLIINPLHEDEVNTVHKIHQQILQGFVEDSEVDLNILSAWVNTKLEDMESNTNNRQKVSEETQTIITPFVFLRISAGSLFNIKKNPNQAPVQILTHPFEMMESQVTQDMWASIMGENPFPIPEGAPTITETINGQQITYAPGYPVNNISWWSAAVFANRLSEKHGLKPVYDFSEVRFYEHSRAEKGNLAAGTGSHEIKINAPFGNIYLAEGYRLPTFAELQLAHSKIEPSNIAYAPLLLNKATVASLPVENHLPYDYYDPEKIEGKPFYGLVNSYMEWTSSGPNAAEGLFKLGLINPGRLNPKFDWARMAATGSQENKTLISEASEFDYGLNLHGTYSFRLARSLDVKRKFWWERLWPF